MKIGQLFPGNNSSYGVPNRGESASRIDNDVPFVVEVFPEAGVELESSSAGANEVK